MNQSDKNAYQIALKLIALAEEFFTMNEGSSDPDPVLNDIAFDLMDKSRNFVIDHLNYQMEVKP